MATKHFHRLVNVDEQGPPEKLFGLTVEVSGSYYPSERRTHNYPGSGPSLASLDTCIVKEYTNETQVLHRTDAPQFFEQLDAYAKELFESGTYDLAFYVED